MKHILLLSLSFLFLANSAFTQKVGTVLGTVKDVNTQEAIIGALVRLSPDSTSTYTDSEGAFEIEAPVGAYSLEVEYLGYQNKVVYNIELNTGNSQVVEINLQPGGAQTLEEVVVINRTSNSVVATDMITPLSTQRLTTQEIRANPGGNFDVSKVVQVLPGVGGGTNANRNDIIVRGGAPNENVYYLDGIEIPVLNHFQTQGASGGATGILNVSFIDDVQLSSSAFNSKYDNVLASTFIIKQRDGNPNHLSGNIRMSGTELAATIEGPISNNTTFIASARRSYLQFLFKAIGLPIRPDYWDFQYKVNHKFNSKTSIDIIGLGAIDHFTLAAPKNASPENEYIIRSNPLINQWTYTVGFNIKRLINKGYVNFIASRNMFFNGADRFKDNVQNDNNRLLKLRSYEIENKFRTNVNQYFNGWKVNYGFMTQYVKYKAAINTIIAQEIKDNTGNIIAPQIKVDFDTELTFFKLGAYAHISKRFINDKLLVSSGLRSDINTFTDNGASNPLRTLSPRLSLSYAATPTMDISATVGRYFKLPTYTNLGFKDNNNNYVNKDLDYIKSEHLTLGVQYLPKNSFRLTIEGFYKKYSNYPVSDITGISLANQGTEFTAVGNEPISSIGTGRAYGIELFLQQKLIKKLFYTFSTTVFKSEYAGANKKLIPSSWDYGYLVSSTVGYKIGKGWEAGAKFRVAGGQPYTPLDPLASRINYLTTGVGTLDYNALNTKRLTAFNQLDLRIDKKFYFRRTTLNCYLDLQNVYAAKSTTPPRYTFERNEDNSDFKTTDNNPVAINGSNAIPYIINSSSGRLIPTIGFIVEF